VLGGGTVEWVGHVWYCYRVVLTFTSRSCITSILSGGGISTKKGLLKLLHLEIQKAKSSPANSSQRRRWKEVTGYENPWRVLLRRRVEQGSSSLWCELTRCTHTARPPASRWRCVARMMELYLQSRPYKGRFVGAERAGLSQRPQVWRMERGGAEGWCAAAQGEAGGVGQLLAAASLVSGKHHFFTQVPFIGLVKTISLV